MKDENVDQLVGLWMLLYPDDMHHDIDKMSHAMKRKKLHGGRLQLVGSTRCFGASDCWQPISRRSTYCTRVEIGYAKNFPEFAYAWGYKIPRRGFVKAYIPATLSPVPMESTITSFRGVPRKVSRYVQPALHRFACR